MATRPFKIGVTGGIGSGKTLVTKIFSVLGIPVYDADTRAKWILNFHPEVKKQIIKIFGEDTYKDGSYNSRIITASVIKDYSLLQKLNNIVHPKVGEDFEEWVVANPQHPYLIKEAALMYEAGSYKLLDKVIVVTAPLDLRIKRIKIRDPHRSEEEIKGIISKQMSEEEKIKRADYVLYNDEQQLLIPQVVALDKIFRSGL